MPKGYIAKDYFCIRTIDFKICGEKNPEKFSKGRFSTCKECRNRDVKERYKEHKLDEEEEKYRKIDPSADIRYMIVDTIKNTPIIDGKSVEDKIKGNEDDITDVLVKGSKDLENFSEEIYKIISGLRSEIHNLKKEIADLKK
jgi:hypothetical protein